MEAQEINRETCRQTASALLFVVLDQAPDHLSLSELIQKFVSERPLKRREEEAAIEKVVPKLEEEGLLRMEDGKIIPTPAAVRFNELLI